MKTSSIDHVVGKLSDAEKLQILAEQEKLFKRQNGVRLDLDPLSKTRDQLEIIKQVNEATNALRQRYGLEGFDVSEENVHIIKKEIWNGTKTDALFIPKTQSIFLKETSRNTRFAVNAFRAMVQFKSYGALQKLTDTGGITEYRRGFIMWPRSGANTYLKYFQELNDAVIEELTIRYFVSQVENPLFRKEIEETRQTKTDASGFSEQALLDVYDMRYSKTKHFDLASFTHANERKALLKNVGELAWKSFFAEAFKGGVVPLNIDKMLNDITARKTAVLDMFICPMFTGNLFPLSRFIDKNAHSAGNLRKIATPDYA